MLYSSAAFIYVFVGAYIFVYIYICTFIFVYIYLCAYVRVYVCVCLCVFATMYWWNKMNINKVDMLHVRLTDLHAAHQTCLSRLIEPSL